MTQEVCLNIGAGKTYIPDFINIDISSRAELQIDIGNERLPFDQSSVDVVFSYHTLEHVDNYLFAISEIYRVLKHGGLLLIGVPYVTLTEYNLVNPFHRHNFSEYSFDFFDPKKKKGAAEEDNDVLLLKIFHRFHYTEEFQNVSEPMRTWCRRHLFNVVKKIDFGLLAIKEPRLNLTDTQNMKKQMIDKFDECLRSRKRY